MGLFDFLKQDKKKAIKFTATENDDVEKRTESDGSKVVIYNKTTSTPRMHRRKRENLNIPFACGFDFENVLVQRDSKIDTDTGELTDQGFIILPDGTNYDRIIRCLMSMREDIASINSIVGEYPSDKVLDLVDYIQQHPRSANTDDEIIDGVDIKVSLPRGGYETASYNATIAVEPLTKTGKPKKFPVSGTVGISIWPGFDKKLNPTGSRRSLFATFRYLPDGSIGRVELNAWLNACGYIATLDNVGGTIELKKLESHGAEGKVKLFPR